MAAFFARLGTKNSQEFGLFGRETVVYLQADRRGDAPAQGRRGQAACRSTATRQSWDDEFDRRKKLADWLTAPDNPFFARNIVNRFWGYTDGPRPGRAARRHAGHQPRQQPRTARRAGRRFVEHKFDLQAPAADDLQQPGVSALSSTITDGNKADAANVHFTRYTVRRLTAEQTGRRASTSPPARARSTGPAARHAGDPVARHAR